MPCRLFLAIAAQWFPPFTTAQDRFYAWRDSGLWEQIVCVLVFAAREAAGKTAAPSVVMADSQSVTTTEAGVVPHFEIPQFETALRLG